MAIRYDKKFNNEINKIVRAYNSKINRLSKKDENYILPEKMSAEALKSLKQTSATRSELRRRLKNLESFTTRGGEKKITVKGVTLPRYQHENIKRYQRLLKIQTTKKLKELENRKPVSNAKEEPFTFSQYGSQEYLTLRAKREVLLNKDLKGLSNKEINKYLDKLIANTKIKNLNVWQDNYISILEDTALSYGYEPDKLEVITSRLRNLGPKEFDDLAFVNRNIQAILYSYKALSDIQTASELSDVGEDVIKNLDSIYDNLDEILKSYE